MKGCASLRGSVQTAGVNVVGESSAGNLKIFAENAWLFTTRNS
jgi:hypothetical protein